MNTLRMAVLHELELRQTWVDFDLVDRGHDIRAREQDLEVLDREVRDANRADLAYEARSSGIHEHGGTRNAELTGVKQLLDLLPHAHEVRMGRVIGEDPWVGVRGIYLDTMLCSPTIWPGGLWPVHEVEVEVLDTEFVQRVVERGLDVLWRVEVIPQLRGVSEQHKDDSTHF